MHGAGIWWDAAARPASSGLPATTKIGAYPRLNCVGLSLNETLDNPGYQNILKHGPIRPFVMRQLQQSLPAIVVIGLSATLVCLTVRFFLQLDAAALKQTDFMAECPPEFFAPQRQALGRVQLANHTSPITAEMAMLNQASLSNYLSNRALITDNSWRAN